MIFLLPHPLPFLRHTGRLRKRDNLLTGQGEGSGRGAESYDGKKSWSSINHSILSALSPPNHPPLSPISPNSQADVFKTKNVVISSSYSHLSPYSRFFLLLELAPLQPIPCQTQYRQASTSQTEEKVYKTDGRQPLSLCYLREACLFKRLPKKVWHSSLCS
jgi:hypothetical protein